MATGRTLVRAAWVVVLAAGWAGAGCYKPRIEDGGFRCTDGGACPEGFHCLGDGVCHKGAAMKCTAANPRIDPICAPERGNDCDPVCQSRCDCGRCNFVGGGLACVLPGNKQRGEVCNRNSDDCAPGNTCVPECATIGRCYRLCGTAGVGNDALCDGDPCNYTVGTIASGELLACQPPLPTCNPVGDSNDCGHAELGCYVTSEGVLGCDCKGPGEPGGTCSTFSSCIPGYRCIEIGVRTCYKTCRLGSTDCAPASVCTRLQGSGDVFGYCPS
jgi:hypothetical protein